MPNCFVLVLKGANLTSRQIDHLPLHSTFIAEKGFYKSKNRYICLTSKRFIIVFHTKQVITTSQSFAKNDF